MIVLILRLEIFVWVLLRLFLQSHPIIQNNTCFIILSAYMLNARVSLLARSYLSLVLMQY